MAAGLLGADLNQLFLAVAVGTMAVTPWMHRLGHRSAALVQKWMPGKWVMGRMLGGMEQKDSLRDHVIIVGYGVNGRNVTRVLEQVNIPFVVVDLGPDSFRAARDHKIPLIYGDATRPEILLHADVKQARLVVVAVSDAASTRRITDLVRRLNPGAHLIVRTRYIREVEPLLAAGAQDVVPEEFETSIEIFSRVLERYLVPRDVIERCMWEVRLDGYEVFRTAYVSHTTHRPLASVKRFLSELSMDVYRVREGSDLVGKALRDSGLRETMGVTVVAIQRPDGEVLVSPGPDTPIHTEDALLLLGRPEKLSKAAGLFGRAADSRARTG